MELSDGSSSSGVSALLELLKFRIKAIEEERLDYLHDVLFRGVVRALSTAVLLVHHGLEE